MRKYSLFLALLLALAFWLFYTVYTGEVDVAPEEPSVETQEFLAKVLPQSWSFFTQDPQEPMLEVYAVEYRRDGILLRKFLFPSGSVCFGISRYSRALLYEMNAVVIQIPPDRWVTGFGSIKKSLVAAFSNRTILPPNDRYGLLPSGNYLLVYRARVPWTLAEDPPLNKQQYSMAYITVR